jgi:hypothetical protein
MIAILIQQAAQAATASPAAIIIGHNFNSFSFLLFCIVFVAAF